MKEFSITKYRNERILTTAQIAEAYKTTEKIVSQNYTRNKEHFIAEKHLFILEGNELKEFKKAYPQIEGNLKFAPVAYLWTKRGAALHAKSLTTQKAWDFYEELVDFYFEVQESKQESQRIYPWTNEAEQLRQLNMKYIQPGYFSIAEVVLQKLIYEKLEGMTPNERAKIDISAGQFFSRWLKGDSRGQLKDCPIYPEHNYDKSKIKKIGHVVDSKSEAIFDVCHYANLYRGDFDNLWDWWYQPVILPEYLGGYLPDGTPRVTFHNQQIENSQRKKLK